MLEKAKQKSYLIILPIFLLAFVLILWPRAKKTQRFANLDRFYQPNVLLCKNLSPLLEQI